MKFSKMRFLAATALAGLLIAGGAAAPATAASPLTGDTTVVTLKGHVTDREGKGIKGISAAAGCPCDAGSGPFVSGADHTSSTGFYSFKVQRQFVKFITFFDHTQKYFSVGYDKITPRKVGSAFIANATLQRTSEISGTVTAVNGAKAHLSQVRFYDAATGKGKGSTFVHADGAFTAHLRAGSYKVRFGGDLYTNSVWYGGVSTSAESPTVTVKYAGSVAGIDATVTPTPSINGSITVDGAKPLNDVRERVAVTITNSAGERVARTVTNSTFSFANKVVPGAYTISARSIRAGNGFVQPLSQDVTVAPGSAVRGLVLNLTSTPATDRITRSSGISFFETSKGIAQAGKVLKGKIVVDSYAPVKGGKALVYVNGKKVDSRVLPASGRFNWRYRPATVTIGGAHPFTVTVRFLGTDTARSRSVVVYGLSGD